MVQRRAFKPTDMDDRLKIVLLWMKGTTVRDIALKTGSSVSTVYRWIKRWQREGNIYGSGRRIPMSVPANLPPLPNTVMDLTQAFVICCSPNMCLNEFHRREDSYWSPSFSHCVNLFKPDYNFGLCMEYVDASTNLVGHIAVDEVKNSLMF
nr:uncharacterized protein LOC128696520 [Cherax quadricarinatus]